MAQRSRRRAGGGALTARVVCTGLAHVDRLNDFVSRSSPRRDPVVMVLPALDRLALPLAHGPRPLCQRSAASIDSRHDGVQARFLTRAQVAEELNISMAQCYALLRRGELRAAKIGGRRGYRIGPAGSWSPDPTASSQCQRWESSIFLSRQSIYTDVLPLELVHPYSTGWPFAEDSSPFGLDCPSCVSHCLLVVGHEALWISGLHGVCATDAR